MPRDLPAARLALDHIGDVELRPLLRVPAVPEVVGATVAAVGDEAEVFVVHELNLALPLAGVNRDFQPARAGHERVAQTLKIGGC